MKETSRKPVRKGRETQTKDVGSENERVDQGVNLRLTSVLIHETMVLGGWFGRSVDNMEVRQWQ